MPLRSSAAVSGQSRTRRGDEPTSASSRGSSVEASSVPRLKKLVEQQVVRINAIDELYKPLREAGDVDLAKSRRGSKLLEDRERLSRQLRELRKRLEADAIRGSAVAP
jgi:hypothetical protein